MWKLYHITKKKFITEIKFSIFYFFFSFHFTGHRAHTVFVGVHVPSIRRHSHSRRHSKHNGKEGGSKAENGQNADRPSEFSFILFFFLKRIIIEKLVYLTYKFINFNGWKEFIRDNYLKCDEKNDLYKRIDSHLSNRRNSNKILKFFIEKLFKD